jgi:transposase
MPCPTPLIIRQIMLALWREGHKQVSIADYLGISQGTVYMILKGHRQGGDNLRPKKYPGRPRLTTGRNDRHLLNLCRRNQKMADSHLCCLWRRDLWIHVYRQTVYGRLLQHGYRARRRTKFSHLTAQHWAARLNWAREHRKLQLGHWRHVFFTGERCYVPDHTDGRQRVWW